ncbi:SacI domain and endonuclease/exonuclease/phosphatase [Coccidioides immitis RS]|uniref:phosphoinositide 5-phosphatase n=2 Tax=Coccidioides immitis TaxID=5501 RepID=J3K3G0_COCIM|nr:SacI domain and endonuclease/exonuclease/phosphatase [Coccidioides immitis RS]EAS28720.3 SacI domain and endonuclease/exonuclease/phosphatase [Coccidioides immitis RS]KMP05827.1 synaptojanin 2 [Coccidioides immitis RMSCC 2394]TPX23089.1 inositol polyphosphate 5-phosphatase [Coccidioides immitis]
MSLRVLCQDHPRRSIALVTPDGHALILEYSPTFSESILSTDSDSNVLSPRCIVKFSSASWKRTEHRLLGIGHGTLGLLTLDNDVFLCVISSSASVASPRPKETVRKITNVDFYCLNRPDYDDTLGFHQENANYAHYSQESDYGTAFQGRDVITEDPFLELKKLLSDGSFYYSTDFNLTNRVQDRINDVAFDIERLDESFLWNSYMIGPLLQFRSRLADHERHLLDSSQILSSVIRGFVQSTTIPSPPLKSIPAGLPATLTLISRLSSRRTGTRFNSRGIDDDGQVSNFVETETILWTPPGITFSYTQVRGSVPIFWEQTPGLIPGQQKIQVTRSVGATQHAFDKHFQSLQLNYGEAHVINLLSETKPGELELSEKFRYHSRHSPLRRMSEKGAPSEHHLLRWTDFDFHAETKGPAGYENAMLIEHKLGFSIDRFAYFLSEDPNGDTTPRSKVDEGKSTIILHQEGVFRTNCLDCLDRTNLVQSLISVMVLERFLMQNSYTLPHEFWGRHSTLWADNGDALSKIYAGTGALKSSFTRHGKMSIAGAIADARKSVTRLYVNNFIDNARQNTIDILLGALTGQTAVHLYDPVNDHVMAELAERFTEFSSTKTVRIWVGTFNVNGRPCNANEDLGLWLHAHLAKFPKEPTLVAVGFQEIVDLSPQQIMSTDPRSRRIWEEAVKKTLDRETSRRGTSPYVLLRSGQLVGAALLLFAKEDVLREIKNVEGSVKKTGLSGIAGNKGGCAIRLEYSNTRICFLTAHLAAGFANYEERNRDYNTIAHGLRFQRNRTINDHDAIIWLGDFNYRIELNDNKVRSLIEKGSLEELYEKDQLNLQISAGVTFQDYFEGPITFPPTYRYNNGTDVYDTSEKRRIPAWCDRVLWKGEILNQVEYNTAPLKFSDHRPVYAVFECAILTVDEGLKARLSHELYEKHKKAIETTSSHSESGRTEEVGLIRDVYTPPGLPPASSDRHKWWLDDGLPIRSLVNPPTDSIRSHYPSSNPFLALTERDRIYPSNPSRSDRSSNDAKSASLPHRRLASSDNVAPLKSGILLDLDFTEYGNVLPLAKRETSAMQELVELSETPKKKGPPVPQKPLSLTKNPVVDPRFKGKGTAMATRALGGTNADDSTYKPPFAARQADDGLQNIPYWNGGASLSGKWPDMEEPHARGSSPKHRTGPDIAELLDSDVDTGMSRWEPLEPGR